MQIRVMRRLAVIGVVLQLALWLGGCASTPLDSARAQFDQGDYHGALQTLDENRDDISDRDRLLLMMSRGIVLHRMGDYAGSNQELLQAAELIDEQSQISISEQLSTLTVNEWLADYRGEYSERLWVHSYLMMNFLLLNDPQSAAVEARRALKVLDRYPSELQEAYFTRALGGLSFETVGLINDAYLEYRVLADQLDDPTPVANRLSRFASQLGIDDSAQTYRDYVDVSSANANPANGELIVFLSQGRIPRKIPGDLFIPPDIRFSWPQYSNYQSWPVEVDVSLRESQADYSLVYSNLGNLARTSLAARGKSIAVRQTVRAVAKHNIVNEVEDQNPLVGGLLQIALFALENADTRGWDTLPGHLGLLRISLPPGEHQVQLMDGNVLLLDFPSVTIRAGEKTFHKVRL